MREPESPDQYVGHDELLVMEEATNYNRHIARLFASALVGSEQPETLVVVDFGAGIGTISHWFYKEAGVRPVAVEVDDNQRAILRSRGLTVYSSLEAVPDDSADLIFSSNVLEHIEHDVAILRELRSKLRHGGRLVLWLPAFPLLWTSLDERVGHYRRYTKASVQHSLRAADFGPALTCRYQDSVGFILALLYRLLGGTKGRLGPSTVRLFDTWLFPVSRVADRVLHRWFGKNVFVVVVKT